MTLAQTIAAARKQAGLRQCDLAEHIGKSTYYIGLIEQGRRRPSRDVAAAIGVALGISLEVDSLRPYRQHTGQRGCQCWDCAKNRKYRGRIVAPEPAQRPLESI